MTGFKSKRAAALDEDGMYLVHQTDHSEDILHMVAHPAQEPVATMKMLHTYGDITPPQRPWVGLTDESITQVIDLMPNGINGWMSDWDLYEFARATEAKLKENNNG